jgi:hypothetical protein
MLRNAEAHNTATTIALIEVPLDSSNVMFGSIGSPPYERRRQVCPEQVLAPFILE